MIDSILTWTLLYIAGCAVLSFVEGKSEVNHDLTIQK